MPHGRYGPGHTCVERLLGEGERKQVYLARDLQMDRDVALGLIGEEPPVDRGLTLTEWECRVTARLVNHPHIVTIYDVGEHEGQRYIVSQYMRGGDLRGVLKSTRAQGRELPLGLALRYASEICDALAYVHHRRSFIATCSPETSGSTSLRAQPTLATST